ncbi:hypothetical protein A3A48_02325 [Candidatus Curtissbacteria bacterium RIFCSPLOWO2_01_FULL_37_9]|uniref:Prephenate/arogenate dehydrogenase domain-containing protein n=1 Tax=Candidatus Curtissbacteria bacterium RIFCSPLOWO2_01_FULL_37_9 TaxID=1797724 RepID=A0A1F5GS23_9BACT|nr:MAG: hypothetical protein A3A48_02325 [Candidatus Curtissbacteria bacterium RIFCSPLOWO2_01_FULL_37_9]
MPEREKGESSQFVPYEQRVATVVGKGVQGTKVGRALESLGFKQVKFCEKDDPFLDFVETSTDLVLAIDNVGVEDRLRSVWPYLTPNHRVLDGSSVKAPLIPMYEDLDRRGVSVAPFHLGAKPDMSWMGIKAWVCTVGPNSEGAKRLGTDIFLSTNSFIIVIDIREHHNIEKAQWLTMATSHIFLTALKRLGFPLERFDNFATLNAELQTQPSGRTAGQGPGIPSEVLLNQPAKWELMQAVRESAKDFEAALSTGYGFQEFLQGNIDYHDNPKGFVKALFEKAGMIGATNANIRMFSFKFRVEDEGPGTLRRLLEPFDLEDADMTAFLSQRAEVKVDEQHKYQDPDKVVDFYVGINPKTVDPEKDRRIKERLVEMGCEITENSSW